MSVRYPEHDCFKDYEEETKVLPRCASLTKEERIEELLEHECQHMTVFDLLDYYKYNKRKEYTAMPGDEILSIHEWFLE